MSHLHLLAPDPGTAVAHSSSVPPLAVSIVSPIAVAGILPFASETCFADGAIVVIGRGAMGDCTSVMTVMPEYIGSKHAMYLRALSFETPPLRIFFAAAIMAVIGTGAATPTR